MECSHCAEERLRRHRVRWSTASADDAHLQPPFTEAPHVHPFRAPSYCAQQLRTILFAKALKRRVLWVTAHDSIKAKDVQLTKDKEEIRKERWLEFHDRWTSGIPGLLPLVLDLPVRFTDSLRRDQGVFKHSRGWLRGWELSVAETARLNENDAPEVVVQERPTKLFIEVETATAKMPKIEGKRIFVLTSQARQWTLDKAGNVKILRHGFPIVPDFGGTAHAYCGTTLSACLGDLLAWHKRHTHDDMLRAYIIKSRVRETQKLLLAQPYSPALFRQGTLPGPSLLMEVLPLFKQEKQRQRIGCCSSVHDATLRPWSRNKPP